MFNKIAILVGAALVILTLLKFAILLADLPAWWNYIAIILSVCAMVVGAYVIRGTSKRQ